MPIHGGIYNVLPLSKISKKDVLNKFKASFTFMLLGRALGTNKK